MKNAFIAVGVAASMLIANAAYADNTAAAKSSTNLVANGDFSAGNTGFTSDYVYADPGKPGYSQVPETQYEITNNIGLVRPDGSWGTGGGPEAGENFMTINGAKSLNADSTLRNFWIESLNLEANAWYKLAFDVQNLDRFSPAMIVLTLGGAQQKGQTTYYTGGANGAQGDWTTQTFLFNSGAGGLTKIGLADSNLAAWGNDFAVGNISLVDPPVPEPATWAMLILGMAMVGFAARRRREATPVAA